MRAIAVLMVLLYHAGVTRLNGGFAGVDVFFVISGFLITSLLLREVATTGTVSIPGFYARRAKRLLPAATLVLVVTTVLGYVVLPLAERAALGREVMASTLYVVNWELASQSIDYLAEDATASAVQHYWSLSVEEQFYVLWPLIMLGAVLLTKRRKGQRWALMAFAILGITVASLLWSIRHTAASPETAYFVTTTRVWELGCGSLLAFIAPHLAGLRRHVAEVLAAAGLVMVASSALWLSTSTPWPGSAALIPVLGTTAVLAAGCRQGGTRTGRALGVAPMRFVGSVSYSLYLWHWPLLVFLEHVRPDPTILERGAVVLTAVMLAWLTKVAVEDPIRFSPAMRRGVKPPLVAGLTAMLFSAAAGFSIVATAPVVPTNLPSFAQGARALMVDPDTEDVRRVADPQTAISVSGDVFPDPELAIEDVPEGIYNEGCQITSSDSDVLTCDYGDLDSSTVWAVIGDSKMAQWTSALDQIGVEEGVRVRTYLKSACAWTDAMTVTKGSAYTSCRTWGQNVLNQLTGPNPPELVITTALRAKAADESGASQSHEALVSGYESYWSALVASGVPVVALSDNPHPGSEVYTCVAEHRQDFSACDFPAQEASGTPALRQAAQQTEGAAFIDVTQWLCIEDRCPPVIGNVLLYRQGSHLTAAYAETLAPVLRAEIAVAERGARRAIGAD
ncbi:MAG: acyltransferase family protein [Ornithinimicrobium sp.]